ncbi:glycosyltransferase family 2 protein [Lyngbya confervoides]|uniref:Glycosyltransferase n=1 Tax=Lyngbya confervoides BDU141951 TaxID=1574623 RepID=A0ABD4T697_9CYAN|nr:glycosyltransferase [Lyngbya confervoides]MCM1983981.1 glycosyltransferase [Lyngbya confervoides BDU141951]
MTSIFPQQQRLRPQLATLIMLSLVGGAGLVMTAWFAGHGTITAIFEQLYALQQQPPAWAIAPMILGEYLLCWTVILMLLVLAITRIWPTPAPWPRRVVVSILAVLTLRYLLWRSVSTLNLSSPLNGVFSLGLLGLELLILTSGMIQLLLMLQIKDRRRVADQVSEAVVQGNYQPTVDVLIPTYEEPLFILKRTVIGCQAMTYAPKTIYLLDDTRRSEVKALAATLGCKYLTRPHNHHAKAGNLNHALPQIQGELVVIFDADFVPTQNFLTRTVGFFQDPQVGLVQTPQSFYNPDPIARNLGLEQRLTPEEEVFYRQVQRVRDGVGAVVCAGTSFVVRRAALDQVGGFVTESLSEDFFTGIQLAAQGYRLVYLNEKLSAGLAADNIAAHAVQRLRWERGTLQAFFIPSNPLSIPGLTPIQRLAYFEGLLHWFSSIARVGFLIMPLAYSFLPVIPLQATTAELLYFFLPFYLVQFSVFSWLNYRSRSALLSDVYALVLAFPLAITLFQVMLRPFSQGFQVTPKGTASDRYQFQWQLAWPLILVFVLTALSLWINLAQCLVTMADPLTHLKGIGLGWIWSSYNLLMLGIALLILLDAPHPSPYPWFNLQRIARVEIEGMGTVWGVTQTISEEGANIALTNLGNLDLTSITSADLRLTLLDEAITLPGQFHGFQTGEDFPILEVSFTGLSLDQDRQLIELLFCRPGQWKSRCAPNELQSLWLIFQTLLRPRIIVDRQAKIRPVLVRQL